MAGGENITGFDGLFDAQLALPLGGTPAPEPFATIQKRDGRVEPFDTAKIAHAIARASAAVAPAEAEHAWDLAKAVRVHLWKQLGDTPPHVDQVHEAVERVLVAMARQRTALAYARYRLRRARRREAERGTPAAGFARLEEDDFAREALGGRPDALLVRTSADTLAAWDRDRIVAALVRETGLREHTAEAIAREVEQQIAAARIESLTASLVRELVDAKLAEHGLGEYRERHRRLGVPLYDTALMLRGMPPHAAGLTPEGTDALFANVLKKEYALAEVFSPAVAEAHLRGDLHLCGLGEIDRFGGVRVPLGALGKRDWPEGAAKSPAHFLARWRQAARFLRGYLQGAVAWQEVAAAAAPVLAGLDDAGYRQFAEMVVFEFAAPVADGGALAAPVSLLLGWPEAGAAPEAVRFCRALVDTLLRARERGVEVGGLALEVAIAPALFTGYPPPEDLGRLTRAAAMGVPVRFCFARAAEERSAAAWLQTVVLNLPRAARHAGELHGLDHWLAAQVRVAAQAHEEKRVFLEELWARGGDGPFAALRAWEVWEGLQPGTCATRIAVEGLREAALLLPGGEAAFAGNALSLLGALRAACEAETAYSGAQFVLCANEDAAISGRFAALDGDEDDLLRAYPSDAAPAYATGLSLPAGRHAVDAAQLHGELCALLDEAPALYLALAPEDYAPASIAGLLQKILHQTQCPAVEITRRGGA